MRPHGLQPPRLLRPWDSPGKRTGVGCHFLLQCMKVKSESEVTQSCPTLSNPMDCSPPGSSIHGIFQPRVLEWGAIAFSRKLYTPCQLPEFTQTHVHCGEGSGNPLQYSCLENSMDRGAWWATVHGITKSRTRLSNFTLQSKDDKNRGPLM